MLDLHGSVDVSIGSDRGRLVAEGRRLVFDVAELSPLRDVAGRRSLRTIATHLHRAGVTLHVRSGGQLVLVAGHDARPGGLSRVLGLPHVQLSPRFARQYLVGR